jgi:RNA polymerase sigma-70 factor (ECF subfamily)
MPDPGNQFETTSAEFGTTSWSEVRAAADDPERLGTLLGRYWAPMYAFLRRRGHDPADAADVVQGFIADVVRDRGLFERADPSRGRLRSLIRTALANYAVDEARRERSRPTRGRVPPIGAADRAGAEPVAEDTPERAFDRAWGASVLQRALEITEAECRAEGMEAHWRAFEARVLGPARGPRSAPGMEEVASAVGATDAQGASNMVRSVKRKLERAMRRVVAETTDEVEEELSRLRSLLG